MDKPKLNKSELTRMRRQIKMYNQFLPVLKLKKERLQTEQLRLKRIRNHQRTTFLEAKKRTTSLTALLPESCPFDIASVVAAKKLVIEEKIIAGVHVPSLESVVFHDLELPRFGLPPWISRGLPRLRDLVREKAELTLLEEQYRRISIELRKASQKVNLFEKVLIPETKEAIRRIEIALGDQQVAAVCRGKIAKSKQAKAALAFAAQSEASP